MTITTITQSVHKTVPYLRSDIVQNASYSKGVNNFLRILTDRAKEKHPGLPLVMMAHMYAKGADIAKIDASYSHWLYGGHVAILSG